MRVSHISLKNWRNFLKVDVDLGERVFLVGPNASGKSNLLDVFRFLRDIAKQGGGLQKAISDRGGVSKIRCLSARKNSKVEIEISFTDSSSEREPAWKYAIGIQREPTGSHRPILIYERVWRNGTQLINRPDEDDSKDKERLTQTYLEQINANKDFREIAKYFESILYLHLVPQILRHPEAFVDTGTSEDAFGRKFLERVAQTSDKIRERRLEKIEKALHSAVPQFKQLKEVRDDRGVPHLEMVYQHWRDNAGKQQEDQFSDGTLRLIGLLWSLLENKDLLLLEEPELSLHSEIVKKLPGLFHQLLKEKHRQLILSTHSYELLSDEAIGGEEVLVLTPEKEGTRVRLASSLEGVSNLLEAGFTLAEAVLPKTKPEKIDQLDFNYK